MKVNKYLYDLIGFMFELGNAGFRGCFIPLTKRREEWHTANKKGFLLFPVIVRNKRDLLVQLFEPHNFICRHEVRCN